MNVESRLKEHLERRQRDGNLRSLMPPETSHDLVDFASNDYLGLARCQKQHEQVQSAYDEHLASQSNCDPILGATGSRLLSGDSNLARSIELRLAELHNRPASLLFNSGYDANLSILSSIPYREGDAIVMDELVHNSLVMGVRMGRLKSDRVYLFKHNDVRDLQRVIEKVQKTSKRESLILVVVESVYSMDGDIAPLNKILDLCHHTGSSLMVDEAHGLGIYGKTNVQDMFLDSNEASKNATNHLTTQSCSVGGTGVLAAMDLEHHPSLFCSVHTFGKAAGCHGAVVAGSTTLANYLVNYARPFVYSTALPPHSLISIQESYKSMTGLAGEQQRDIVFKWVKLFRTEILDGLSAIKASRRGIKLLPSPSPIQALIIPGSKNCIAVCKYIREGGLDVYPIRSPTVPKGEERIRIILHSHNTDNQIRRLVHLVLESLNDGQSRSKL